MSTDCVLILTFLAEGRRICPLSEHACRDVASDQRESIATLVHGFHAVCRFWGNDQSVAGSLRQMLAPFCPRE